MSKMFFLTITCFLQLSTLNAYANEQSIRVTGECKRKVYPDEEIYQLSFVKSGKDNKVLQDEVSKRATTLIEELKKELDKNIELNTTSFQSYPQYQWIKDRNVFQGHQVRYSLEITLKNFSLRDSLQKLARNSGAEEWSGPTHNLSDNLKLKERDICLKNAMEDARKKASVIAASANVQLTNLKSANEIQSGLPSFPMFKAGFGAAESAVMDQMTAPPIMVRELDYQITLEVSYLFK